MKKLKNETTTNKKVVSKHPTSFKLSDTALDILTSLSIERGIAKSAVIENLLRDEIARARKETIRAVNSK